MRKFFQWILCFLVVISFFGLFAFLIINYAIYLFLGASALLALGYLSIISECIRESIFDEETDDHDGYTIM